jgi:hypothetical protein
MREPSTTVLTPTESRQASPRLMNLRVLIVSMVALVGIAPLLFIGVYNPRSSIGLPRQPPAAEDAASPPSGPL